MAFLRFQVASGNSRINAVRSTITNSAEGIAASASAGTATITFSDSMVTGNTKGFSQGGGGTLNSLVNNIITDNGSNTGTRTTLLPPVKTSRTGHTHGFQTSPRP